MINPFDYDIKLDAINKKTVVINGVIEDIQIKNDVLRLYIKKANIESVSGKLEENSYVSGILASVSDTVQMREVCKLGRKIKIKGVYELFDVEENEGAFNARRYYKTRGYEGQLKRAIIQGYAEDYGYIIETLRQIREKSKEILYTYMEEAYANVASAIILGDKTELDLDVKSQYQNAGISHVLALSGLHIATTGIFILKLLRKIGFNIRLSSIISSVIILGYCCMTGFSISTVRAFLMFSLSVLSICVGRSYDILSAAAFSAILMLGKDPYYLFDSGFQLSYGAIIAIGCVLPVVDSVTDIKSYKLIKGLNKRKNSFIHIMLEKIRQSLGVSISVMLTTLPITAYSFFQISKISIVFNIIVIPLMSAVLFTGFGGVIMGYTNLSIWGFGNGLLNTFGKISLSITCDILKLYDCMGKIAGTINGNIIVLGRPKDIQILLYYIIMTVALIIMCIGNKYTSVLRNNKHSRSTYIITDYKFYRKNKKIRMISNLSGVFLLIIAYAVLTYHNSNELEIRNIYVGQGDSCVIWGKEVPTIMIDCGSSSMKNIGRYNVAPVLKSNKVSQVDYCFLTHMDADHVSGIVEILEDRAIGISVKNLVVSESFLKSVSHEDELYNHLMELCQKRDCKLLGIGTGDYMRAGKYTIKCLGPNKSSQYTGNDSSIVLEIDGTGFGALFMGDASSDVENKILKKLSDIDYLKVGHHGSKYSSSAEFLDVIKPEVAIISAGVDNSYGHPHDETIDRLKKGGALIYDTSKHGEIILKVCEGEAYVRKYRK